MSEKTPRTVRSSASARFRVSWALSLASLRRRGLFGPRCAAGRVCRRPEKRCPLDGQHEGACKRQTFGFDEPHGFDGHRTGAVVSEHLVAKDDRSRAGYWGAEVRLTPGRTQRPYIGQAIGAGCKEGRQEASGSRPVSHHARNLVPARRCLHPPRCRHGGPASRGRRFRSCRDKYVHLAGHVRRYVRP